MKTRKLGSNGPEFTVIGLGSWAIGGSWKYGWGPSDDAESIRTIHRALDLGINWIDTAAVYGLGHSEEIVGKALEGVRKDVYIATKCGLVWDDQGRVRNDISPASIRREAEASLKRLKTDYIDLYQIHWPHANQSEAEAWHEMTKLQKEGKVRWIGVSNFDVPLLRKCEAIHHVDSLQPPYNLIRREVEKEILPYCLKTGIGVVAYSPMMSGLLSGRFDRTQLAPDDWRQKEPLFREPLLSRYLQKVEKMRQKAADYNATVGNLAVAWVLRHPAVTSAIVGARKVAQVEENVRAAEIQLTDEDAAWLEALFAEP
ncbi:MAG: aldo/keto reductase [candidate division KSB1 bacterium]|nr:aldo/keto reductase [candidate division KSB1 bacterium]MDZ7345334.1 aldo/keto reductase [candidate division KSB1 bacterium]